MWQQRTREGEDFARWGLVWFCSISRAQLEQCSCPVEGRWHQCVPPGQPQLIPVVRRRLSRVPPSALPQLVSEVAAGKFLSPFPALSPALGSPSPS